MVDLCGDSGIPRAKGSHQTAFYQMMSEAEVPWAPAKSNVLYAGLQLRA